MQIRATKRLSSYFARVRPAQGSCSGNRKCHLPEVGIRGRKLDSDIGLSIPLTFDRDNSRLHGAVGILVDELESLPHEHEPVHMQQCSIPVDRLRMGASAELFSLIGLTVYCKWNRQRYPQSAASLFAPKVNNRHGTGDLSCCS